MDLANRRRLGRMRVALLSKFIHRRRHRIVQSYLGKSVLDLGCGPASTISLLHDGQDYVGVELRQARIDKLRAQFPQRTFHRRNLDQDALNLGNVQFDTILLLAVVEHLERPRWLLSQLSQYIRPSGRVLLTTPSPLGDTLLRVGSHLRLFHLHGVGDHKDVYGASGFARLLEDTGLVLLESHKFLLGANQLFVCGRAVAGTVSEA